MPDAEIVLASASQSRADLLEGAGLEVLIHPANIDEAVIKNECRQRDKDVATTAAQLAREKSEKISNLFPDAFVIGADQMLDCGGEWLDKPVDMAAAVKSLRFLRGRTHELVTSVSIMRSGREQWCFTDRAKLVMRDFSDEFLETYLHRVGAAALSSVGAYQLEGLGAQLFERIDGDYFTILGLPLLSVLGYLRDEGALTA
tara:strand:- start:509 stop:1111 length:603 start_codon:yes stop_codon:yes gene_type:complete